MQISSISRSGWCSGIAQTSGPNRSLLVRCATAREEHARRRRHAERRRVMLGEMVGVESRAIVGLDNPEAILVIVGKRPAVTVRDDRRPRIPCSLRAASFAPVASSIDSRTNIGPDHFDLSMSSAPRQGGICRLPSSTAPTNRSRSSSRRRRRSKVRRHWCCAGLRHGSSSNSRNRPVRRRRPAPHPRSGRATQGQTAGAAQVAAGERVYSDYSRTAMAKGCAAA